MRVAAHVFYLLVMVLLMLVVNGFMRWVAFGLSVFYALWLWLVVRYGHES